MKKKKHFMVKMSVSVFSDEDGHYYINPSEGNIERLIKKSLGSYTDLPDLQIRKLEVIASQLLEEKGTKHKEEKVLVDIDKLVKLRNQVESAIKLEEADKAKFEGDDGAWPAFQYHLGKVHSLNEFKEKLDDLIIQG